MVAAHSPMQPKPMGLPQSPEQGWMLCGWALGCPCLTAKAGGSVGAGRLDGALGLGQGVEALL